MSSPQPITLSEIYAYFRITDIHDRETRSRYLRVLQDMDEVYLTFMAEKAERERPKHSK